MELNKYDYELLKFIQNKETCSLDDILNKFPDNIYGTKYRLRLLSEEDIPMFDNENLYYSELKGIKFENYIVEHKKTDEFVFSDISANMFSLSSKGIKTLLDYKLYQRKTFLKYIKNFIFEILPITISSISLYISYLALKVK